MRERSNSILSAYSRRRNMVGRSTSCYQTVPSSALPNAPTQPAPPVPTDAANNTTANFHSNDLDNVDNLCQHEAASVDDVYQVRGVGWEVKFSFLLR